MFIGVNLKTKHTTCVRSCSKMIILNHTQYEKNTKIPVFSLVHCYGDTVLLLWCMRKRHWWLNIRIPKACVLWSGFHTNKIDYVTLKFSAVPFFFYKLWEKKSCNSGTRNDCAGQNWICSYLYLILLKFNICEK